MEASVKEMGKVEILQNAYDVKSKRTSCTSLYKVACALTLPRQHQIIKAGVIESDESWIMEW